MSDEVRIDFGKPIPVFPLQSVTLLPQQVLPLHVFEPRYVQMVKHALDGGGLIAMGVFDGPRWKQEYHGRPPVKPVVCVGHIVQHTAVEGGRYNLLLQGVCRARIMREEPGSAERLYRAALLEPFGDSGATDAPLMDDDSRRTLGEARKRITSMLAEGPLANLAAAEPVLEYLRDEDISNSAILELVSFPLVLDARARYRLLEEGDAKTRAGIILHELDTLERLVRMARVQHPEHWPKGLSWN
jgi:hypothetical protein